MNATSLYVSTSRLVFQQQTEDQELPDLYRLVPYLRQSLACTVCGNLLVEPFTPQDAVCQHHVCGRCIGGRKNLKPSCSWCRDYDKYKENTQLRLLLQCYKSLCEYIVSTPMYKSMHKYTGTTTNGNSSGCVTSMAMLIQEGAHFKDNFKCNAGLSKSALSILPCLFQRNRQADDTSDDETTPPVSTEQTIGSNIKTVSNGSALYSVMYAGTGNKITIKRKNVDQTVDESLHIRNTGQQFKKPATFASLTSTPSINVTTSSIKPLPVINSIGTLPSTNITRGKTIIKRKGCRCGNATLTPGKLTCCGQRCPCYVESKSCVDCKCRGCRNPHRADGQKIRPRIPELDSYEIEMNHDVKLNNPSECIEFDALLDSNLSNKLSINRANRYIIDPNRLDTMRILDVLSLPDEMVTTTSLPPNILFDDSSPDIILSGSTGSAILTSGNVQPIHSQQLQQHSQSQQNLTTVYLSTSTPISTISGTSSTSIFTTNSNFNISLAPNVHTYSSTPAIYSSSAVPPVKLISTHSKSIQFSDENESEFSASTEDEPSDVEIEI